MNGEELTRWTIWIALAGYALGIGLAVSKRASEPRRTNPARLAWTIGCVFLWLHVALAFQAYHHWSHDAAYEHTARETEAVTGVAWGGGIYFNYFTMLLWAADALWWWISPASYSRRPRLIVALVHGWFAFMIFNATVVFETGPVRWVALAVTAALAVMAVKSKIRDFKSEI